MSMVLRIYADDREKVSGIPELLKELGVVVILTQLSVADYVISENVAVERKAVTDLVNSVFDKRFFDQLNRLSEAYNNPILIIEGDISIIRNITEKWRAINNALIAATIDYNMKVLYSRDRRDTAEILKKLAEKYQLEYNYGRRINLHNKSKLENISDIQLYIVESFPYIGATLAEKLLTKFSTIQNICNASIADLEKAIGSRKKAEDIYKILRTPYLKSSNASNNNKKKSSSLFDFL